MFENLKAYCLNILPFSPEELALIDRYFQERVLKKKEFLLQDGDVCDFIAFIEDGCIRHFHIKDGDERTCDISFGNTWVTDFQSFTKGSPSNMNLQAMAETTVNLIIKNDLEKVYAASPKFETFGRIMAEQVAQRATEIAMSLSSEKPEERYNNLVRKQPTLFQQVPQKYIANFLGISPESLSRIRSRSPGRHKS